MSTFHKGTNTSQFFIYDTQTSGNITLPPSYSLVVLIIDPPGTSSMTANRDIILPVNPANGDSVEISIMEEIFEGQHAFRYTVKNGATDLAYVDRRTALKYRYHQPTNNWLLVR
jgi:hypothetical protein